MSAPAAVADLVERFASHSQSYHSDQYNEAQLREEFLNPLFEALGWDIYNRKGYAEAYKEVIHEAAIKVGGRTKAPDYCFRVGGGVRSFFVEAKKPAVDIREAVAPAYQLRRYAWSAKLPVSILTDFEEFAVYDCRVRPVQSDRASTARIQYLNYTEYLERWDDLAGRFSPEAIRLGALDRFVATQKVKKGTAEVDAVFLEEIESWRDALARNMALRNGDLPQRDLNFAVQRTIDRIVFLRICEDRGMEPYGRLQSLLNGPSVYARLVELFERADERYNSGLFHFTEEPNRSEPPDQLTLALAIDDKPLKDILKNLYYPESPYEFSVFPAEILGQVYEQFLGKVIRLTGGHRAVVEDKPEVKKAGGVYYTPAYIVHYIVRHTVGALLEGEGTGNRGQGTGARREGRGMGNEGIGAGPCRPGASGEARGDTGTRSGGACPALSTSPPLPPGEGRGEGGITPKQAARLRILDPACGSGSFLIGAYQYLLDWHRDWYVEHDAERHARGRNPALYRGTGGDWRLTTTERKRILLNNVYGVDIDPQAVEVTKLSLVLKVLEGETEQTLDNQRRLFHERALPDLGANIKCGNSLIGPDFYENRQRSLLEDEEKYRVNAFHWRREFPVALETQDPGFHVVIGNPPWVMAGYYLGAELDYLRRRYRSAVGKFDLYYAFMELGVELLAQGGRMGLIVPNKFFHTNAAQNLRSLLSERRLVHEIIDFGYERVFAGATNYSAIVFLRREPSKTVKYTCARAGLAAVASHDVKWHALSDEPWNFVEPGIEAVFAKMRAVGAELGTMVERFGTGAQTGADRILLLDPPASQELGIERGVQRPIYRGRDVRRYEVAEKPKTVVFPYADDGDNFVIYDEVTLRSRFPNAWHYLCGHKGKLASRVWFGKNAKQLSGQWYGMMYLDSRWAFRKPHILTPSLSNRSNFAMGDGSLFVTGTAGVTSIIPLESAPDIKYLLGVLNSKLMSSYAIRHSPVFQGAYYKFSAPYLRHLPIRPVDLSKRAEKAQHSRVVESVDVVLDLVKRRAKCRTTHERTVLERQIEATDRQIDRLVYDLYGLTDEEIAIVEEATG